MEKSAPTPAQETLSPSLGHAHEVYENFVIQLTRNGHKNTAASFASCFFSDMGLPSQVNWATVGAISERKVKSPNEYFVELELSLSEEKDISSPNCVPIGHAPACPAREIHLPHNSNLKSKLPNRSIRVGVCCVVQHADHLLITRRSGQLRTFPHKWVVPGGHVNLGESLEDAAAREAFEETGLRVCNLKPFACWESCFPTFLEMGVPTAHHLVIYYLASLDPRYYTLSPDKLPDISSLSLQAVECDAAAWLAKDVAFGCLHGADLETEFDAIVPNEQGVNAPAKFKTKQLMGTANRGPVFESFALGTVFVIKTWLGLSHQS